MGEPMDERLTDLEIKIMLQERTIQELSDVLYLQQQKLDRLETEVRGLREQLIEVSPSMLKTPDEEEPPPHY